MKCKVIVHFFVEAENTSDLEKNIIPRFKEEISESFMVGNTDVIGDLGSDREYIYPNFRITDFFYYGHD